MIRFAQDLDQPPWHGYLYAVLLFLAAVLQSLLLHQYFHRCMLIGMNMRSSIIAAVYNKVRWSSRAWEGPPGHEGGSHHFWAPVCFLCAEIVVYLTEGDKNAIMICL